LLGRWSEYITMIHGDNGAFKQLHARNSTALEAVEVENVPKRKLQTISFGYNHN